MGLNKIVDFSIAKLLKEKGFIKPVKQRYFIAENIDSDRFPFLQEECALHNWNDYDDSSTSYYSAPTISEVVCWIYSKYQIWIQVSILKDDEWRYSIRRKDNNWNIEFPTKGKYISIENAYEKGINVVLNTYKPKS